MVHRLSDYDESVIQFVVLTENDVFLKMNYQMMAASSSKVIVLVPFFRRIMCAHVNWLKQWISCIIEF